MSYYFQITLFLVLIVVSKEGLFGMNDKSHAIVMVRPTFFSFNHETAATNHFSHNQFESSIAMAANQEFSRAVKTLQDTDFKVIVLESPENAPDAVFPNNWFSLHISEADQRENILFLYPMLTTNRSIERLNTKPLVEAMEIHGLEINRIVDLSHYESDKRALEGTGSLIFDPDSEYVFMARSKRSDERLANMTCSLLGKKLMVFDSYDCSGNRIYHTNVMMSVGVDYALYCEESIPPGHEKDQLKKYLEDSKKSIICISHEQVGNMCGNIIEAVNMKGEKYMIMSQTAYDNFTREQLLELKRSAKPLPLIIPTIESIGGGSARCMIAITNFEK